MIDNANGSNDEQAKENDILLIRLFLKEMTDALKTSSVISEEEIFNKTINKYGLFNIQFSEEILHMLQNYNSDIELLKNVF